MMKRLVEPMNYEGDERQSHDEERDEESASST